MTERPIDEGPETRGSSGAGDGSLAPVEVSRRRFLKNAAVASVAVPGLGALLAACSASPAATPASARSKSSDVGSTAFASHPKYRFTLVNHVTTNTFFTATRFGAQDACNLLGCSYQWTGSQDSIVSQMTNAMDEAIAAKVDGIGVALIDPVAFNTPTDRALSNGIPVVSYNADEPGNNRMAYIGQNNLTAGAAAAERIVKVVPSGSLVGMVIATPGSGNIQPRIDGALPIFKKAGLDTAVVAGGALQSAELTAVESWYQGHQDVKFLYAVDSGDAIAVATTIKKNGLKGKVGGSGWDVGVPTLEQVQNGALSFSIDQQAYLQGFVPILQLFLYQLSGGLMQPCDTDTGLGFVTKGNVSGYLEHATRFEGSGTKATDYAPPARIAS